MNQEPQKTKEVIVFGELGREAMKSDGQYVIVIQGKNQLSPEKTFALKVQVPEDEPSHITLQNAYQSFGGTVGLKGVGVHETELPEEATKPEAVVNPITNNAIER